MLSDGNVWMTKNMRLDFSNLKSDISAQNTNNPTSTFISEAAAHPSSTEPSGWCSTNGGTCVNKILFNATFIGNTNRSSTQDRHWATYGVDHYWEALDYYGAYYNWYTATAGNGVLTTTSGDPSGSLCPKGWHLPTSTEIYNSVDRAHFEDYYDAPAKFSHAGEVGGTGSFYGLETRGYYWSSTAESRAYAYMLSFSVLSSSSDEQNGLIGTSAKYNGLPLRCVLDNANNRPGAGTYQIIFDKNDGSGDTSVQQVNVGDTVTLTANPWQRDNYTFNGWNTSADGTGTSYADEEEVSNLASRDEAIVLYAQWEATAPEEMQGWSCNLSTGDSTTLSDSRDGQTYTIAKLADGNCWMIDNLNLGATSLTTNLTSDNSNLSTTVTAATFNSWKKSNGYFNGTYSGEYRLISGSDSVSQSKYGASYNYYATTGGTISGDSNRQNASYDICPVGWRLPTTSEVTNLFTQYGYTSSLSASAKITVANKLRAPLANGGTAIAPAGDTLPGWQLGAYDDQLGRTAYYWTSNAGADTLGYFYGYSFATSGDVLYISVGGIANRQVGHSIRCLLKDSSYDAGT